MYRVEDKYILSDIDMFILEKRIAAILDSDYFSRDGSYTISSVYFDDYRDTHLNDTLDGIDSRDKYRIRIYNGSFDVIKLEIKHKLHNRIRKDSCSITYDELTTLLSGQPIRTNIATKQSLDDPVVQFNLAIMERKLVPKVIVTYERAAYVCNAGNVRITFDRNVRSSEQIEKFGDMALVHDSVVRIPESSSILEVKYDEFLPEYIADTLEMGNLWQVSYSKYGLCREVEECQ